MRSKHFLDQYLPEGNEGEMLLLQEGLILDTTETIFQASKAQGISLTKMGEIIGKSRASISRLLSGDSNMTLRTLSDLAFALGMRPSINLIEIENKTQLNVTAAACFSDEDKEWMESSKPPITLPHSMELRSYPIPGDYKYEREAA